MRVHSWFCILILALAHTELAANPLVLKREGWLFSVRTEFSPNTNFCELQPGSYHLGEKLLTLKKVDNQCELNGFYRCTNLSADPAKREFNCDGKQIEFSGIPINNTSRDRDLAILHFAENEVDFCKQAYTDPSFSNDYVLNNNRVRLTPRTHTETYLRECHVKGDLKSDSEMCSNVYFTRLGVVCVLGSDAQLLPFKHHVSVTDLTEGVINHYRPAEYDFALSCDRNRIQTSWQTSSGEQLIEQIFLDQKDRVQEVITRDREEYLSHRFDKRGHYYEVLNLERLVEKPKSRQTSWQFYQPSVTRSKKFSQTYFWVNYLGSLVDCCQDQRCQENLHNHEYLRNRLPAAQKH